MPSSAVRAEIKARLTGLFYQNLPGATLVHVAASVLLYVMLEDLAEGPYIAIWAFDTAVVTVLLAGLYIAFFKAQPQPERLQGWRHSAVVVMAIAGMSWGSSVWLLLPPLIEDHSPHLMLFTVIYVLGAAGMSGLYGLLRAYYAFLITMVGLAIGHLLMMHTNLHVVMIISGVLFTVMMGLFAKRHRDELIKSLLLRAENRSLLERLERENKTVRHENLEKGRMEQLLRQKTAVLDAVSYVQALFIADRDSRKMFDETLKAILDLTNSEYGFIGEVKHDDEGVPYLKSFAVTDIAWDEETRAFYDNNAPTGMEFRNTKSLFGEVLTTGEPVIANDPANDPRACGLPPGHPPLSAFLGIPLYLGEDMVGMFGLANREGGYDLELLTALDPVISAAASMVDAIQNRRSRQEAQAEAAHAMERLSTAIEALNDGFVIFDSDDRLLLCNSKYREIYGDREGWIVPGMTFEEIVRGGISRDQFPLDEDPANVEEWVANRMFLHRQPESLLEQKLANGTWLRVEERATPDGGRVGFRVDITELKGIQSALEQARIDAEKANQAKTDFLSSMSHELRTPMNAVLGFAQLLMLNPQIPLHERQKDSVEQILKAGNHLLELINEILDLSRIESGRINLSMEELDPCEVLKECIAYIAPLAERRGLVLDTDMPDAGSFSVHTDRTRFKQVLLNLLSNAVKYNTDNGTVALSVHAADEGFVRFCVSDTGPGISADKQEEIFEPFSRLGAETTDIEGTGIGLTITRKLAQLMGGQLEFESVVGHGSKFWVDLPGASVSAAPLLSINEDGDDQLPALPDGMHTVLYVEDNPDNLSLMQHVIAMVDGAQLITAHTGELGLEMADIHKPDVILMDINLPGINGIEAMQRLRARPETRDIPVLAISADAMPADIKRGLDAGFDAYLTKPINLTEVIDHIGRALEGEWTSSKS